MTSELEDKFQTLHEIVRAARMNLAPGPWDYLVGGTETETTLRRNRQALDSVGFRPRVLRDVGRVDSGGTWLGQPVRLPVMLAPIGSIESFTPGGAATAAKAAARFGIPQMLSSACNPGLEATAQAAENHRIFQLYVRGDDAVVDDWVRRSRDHGYRGFCMTVDSAYYSRRERDLARRFVKSWRASATGLEYQRSLSWDQVKRFKDTHPDVPLVLKGIATAEDARMAVEHGADVVYVSNHGGRQLDGAEPTIRALPRVADRVAGRMEILVDGGVRRGTDVVKALALGARAALVAMRPPFLPANALSLPMDARVLGFTALAAVLTGVLFGVAPALQLSRPDLALEVKDRTGQPSSRRRSSTIRRSSSSTSPVFSRTS